MSTFIYAWYDVHDDPKKVLRRNKQFFKDRMTQTIDHIQQMMESLPSFFKDPRLTGVLIEERDRFLDQYNLGIFLSPSHTQWVDTQIEKFQSHARGIKQYCFHIQALYDGHIDRHMLESLMHCIPLFANTLREKIERMIRIIDDIDKICSEENPDMEVLQHYMESLPEEFFHLKQKINQRLLKSIRVEKPETIHRKELESLREEASNTFQKIQALSEDLSREYEALVYEMRATEDINRAELILDEIRYALAKARSIYVRTQVLKDELLEHSELAQKVGMHVELKKLLDQSVIREEEVETFTRDLYRKYFALQKEQEVIASVSRMLAKYGYETIDSVKLKQLMDGHQVEISTPFGEDYKLRIKLQKNTLAIRFIKYVDDESRLSAYEREKDKAIAREWCSAYDRISELLASEGIILESQYRIEPDTRFYYISRKSSFSLRYSEKSGQDRDHYKGGEAK